MSISAIILTIAIYLIYQIADAFGDVAIEFGKQKEWHFWGSVTAFLFICTLSFIMFKVTLYTAYCIVFMSLLRFPVFNILHNLRKGQAWYYLSDHGIDKLVKKILHIK